MTVSQLGAPITFSSGTTAVSADVNSNFSDIRTAVNALISATDQITIDTIVESTSAAGVTIDSVLLKDGSITQSGNITFSGSTASLRMTDTCFNLGDGAGGRVGFYTTVAIAKQTGVAVSAGGVHAALVALGLFTGP